MFNICLMSSAGLLNLTLSEGRMGSWSWGTGRVTAAPCVRMSVITFYREQLNLVLTAGLASVVVGLATVRGCTVSYSCWRPRDERSIGDI